MWDREEFEERYTDADCEKVIASLFPNGFSGEDVIAEIAPEGWEHSALYFVFHPPPGAVTRGSGSKNEDKERNIRKWFVDSDLIDGVIQLPENLFYNTTAAGVIVVCSKRKPAARKDKIVLLNATRRFKKGQPKNFIPEEFIRPLAAAYLKGEPVDGEVAVVTREQIQEADYSLSPSRWIAGLTASDDGTLREHLECFEASIAAEAEASRDLITALAKLRALA